MSMEPTIIAYARIRFTQEGVVASPAYNCTAADAGSGVGDFDLTIGEGGVDRTQCQIVVIGDSGGLAAPSVIHTSDTVKRIQFRDAAGALVTPTNNVAWVEVHRLPPLPAP